MRFEMRLSRLLTTILALGVASAALSGCDSMRRAAGLNKKSPSPQRRRW
jgi:predicted small secreted protein